MARPNLIDFVDSGSGHLFYLFESLCVTGGAECVDITCPHNVEPVVIRDAGRLEHLLHFFTGVGLPIHLIPINSFIHWAITVVSYQNESFSSK